MIDKQRARLGDMANGLRGAGGTISISRQDAVRLGVDVDDESEVVEIAAKIFVSLVDGLGRDSEQDSEEPPQKTEGDEQGSEPEQDPEESPKEEPPKKAPAKKTPTKKNN